MKPYKYILLIKIVLILIALATGEPAFVAASLVLWIPVLFMVRETGW